MSTSQASESPADGARAGTQQSGAAEQRPVPRHARPDAEPAPATAWLGWVLFTSILLAAAGVVNAIQGLVALFNEDFFHTSGGQLPAGVNFTVWGWAFLVVGAILIVAGLGLALGHTWARVVGVLVAAVNLLVNLGFADVYPAWTAITVALDVITIYALTVHGGEGRLLRIGRN
jgi:hypothetical protein